MARYELLIKRAVAKDLRVIPNKDVKRILDKIHALPENPLPPGVEKLAGQDKYRLRQGNYRILYTVDNHQVTITVIKVAHRREVYRQHH